MTRVVLEVLSGVAPWVEAEIGRTVEGATVLAVRDTEVEVDVPESVLGRVKSLHTPVAAYLSLSFTARRPIELLSTPAMTAVLRAVDGLRALKPRSRFGSFRISAAGSDSPEFLRFRDEFAQRSGLEHDEVDGEMLLRIRRAPDTSGVWQVLLRMTPRPLSARPWRVVNYPGAVNATIAAAVIDSLGPSPEDEFLDLMCGSGTLVIERLHRGRPKRLVACDLSAEALDAARTNQRAAKYKGAVDYLQRDVLTLPETGWTFSTLVANLPWGELHGRHEDNDSLYAGVLAAAAALARPGAAFGVLTHDIRRFESALAASSAWQSRDRTRFFQKGHHPRLYLLARR